MIYTTENNWYKWGYDNNPFFEFSSSSDSIFKTYYGEYTGKISEFKEELMKASKSTLDHYPGLRPCIFFSGGLDSEVILRSYLEIGSKPEVFIVRYENDYNIYDVSYAIAICTSLGVKYNLIDFNLKKFYENEAEEISEKSQIDRPRALPQIKFPDYSDGLSILGFSDVSYIRLNDDYKEKGRWVARCWEHDVGGDKYNILYNRNCIHQWWKWTPGLVISYTKLKWFKKLINDEYYGKLGINSTKYIGFSEVYPNLIYRKKQTGFELIDALILEFETFLNKKYNGLPFRRFHDRTVNQLWSEITGKPYLEC